MHKKCMLILLAMPMYLLANVFSEVFALGSEQGSQCGVDLSHALILHYLTLGTQQAITLAITHCLFAQ